MALTSSYNNRGDQLLHVRDEKPTGLSGGMSLAKAWNRRGLNVVVSNVVGGASINAGLVTLPAGAYGVQAYAIVRGIGRHRLRLWNVTDAVQVLAGHHGFLVATVTGRGEVAGRFYIGGTRVLELQHWTERVEAVGLGLGEGRTPVELYAEVRFRKIA